jgi:hypothetical protein
VAGKKLPGQLRTCLNSWGTLTVRTDQHFLTREPNFTLNKNLRPVQMSEQQKLVFGEQLTTEQQNKLMSGDLINVRRFKLMSGGLINVRRIIEITAAI